jgi:hypothetical protein
MSKYTIAGNEIEMTESEYKNFVEDRENLPKGQFLSKWKYLWEA